MCVQTTADLLGGCQVHGAGECTAVLGVHQSQRRKPAAALLLCCPLLLLLQAEPPQDPTRLKQVLKDTFTAFNTAIERYV
jgi:hypothetical protein